MNRYRTSDLSVGELAALALAGLLIPCWFVLSLSASLAELITRGQAVAVPPSAIPHILAGLPDHWSDPRLAYPARAQSQLPGPVAMWLSFVVVIGAVAIFAWCCVRFLPWRRRPGYANSADVRTHLSLQAARRRARQTRPALDTRRAEPNELGLFLGRDVQSRQRLYGSAEDSYLYLGPPRSGKGVNLIIPQALVAPGAVLVTATRPDTLQATLEVRRGRGPVAVFDPHGISGQGDRLRWSPVRGCTDPLTAILRARALTAGAKLAHLRDGEFWDGMTQAVVRCYLHAAALDGRPIDEVLGWVGRPGDPTPVRILRNHRDAAPGWAEELSAQAVADPRQRDSVWAGVRRAFDSLADPRVLAACSPSEADAFDATRFLADHGTLFLVGSSGAQLSVAPLITALVEDLVETARRLAAKQTGGRLDPPLLLLLDEAANSAPVPSLPSLLADGGGAGITTVAVLQSLAQARARWGEPTADAMWDAATVKVVLGGLAHADDLTKISRLAGDIDEPTYSRTRGSSGSVTTSVRRVPALPVERIRGLAVGRALVLARRSAPVEAVLTPHWRCASPTD